MNDNMVTCKVCREVYDEVNCWTICPHRSTTEDPYAPFCLKHNQYDCEEPHEFRFRTGAPL